MMMRLASRIKSPQGSALFVAALGVVASSFDALAQAGDRAGETQSALPAHVTDFPSPTLGPHESLERIQVQPGFRVELIASEPLIHDPVAMDIDDEGRLWVVEMRGYMRTIDGEGEHDPISRVVVLDDTDGDGVMDESTVFLDRLTQPRSIACAYGGVLIVEPPDLLFCKDTDGDGRADVVRRLWSGFAGLQNPEHAGNGLLHTMDNWIHTSQHPARFRFDGERVITQRLPGHGQWGITMDDTGRVFVNTNSDPLRVDLLPAHYAARNESAPNLVGVNERVMHDMRTWPIHPTPGINRGYQDHMLREHRLARFTAACGPCIYRGDAFGPSFRGNAFIAEPAGNLIRRGVVREQGRGLVAENPYEEREFLASTDERFRPVNIYNGPNGGLFVLDFYRGIIQHRIYMTSFLRAQVVQRNLDEPVGLGRIYRIVPENAPAYEKPRLDLKSDAELVSLLSSSNGWIRDTAQRLLVERRARGTAPQLRRHLTSRNDPIVRLHAYWTLDGIGALRFEDALRACQDEDAHVRRCGVRLLERWIDEKRTHDVLLAMADDDDEWVLAQVALSLGEGRTEQSLDALLTFLTRRTDAQVVRSAVNTGLAGREARFFAKVLAHPAWTAPRPGTRTYLRVLTETIWQNRSSQANRVLLDLLAGNHAHNNHVTEVVIERLAKLQRIETDRARTLVLDREPTTWVDMLRSMAPSDDQFARTAHAVDAHVFWPGRPGMAGPGGPRALTTSELIRFERGKRLYEHFCMSCHQQNGRGQAGTAPALAENEHVNGNVDRLARVLLHGMSGPITVQGQSFDASMPKSPATGDDEIAAILTYIRRAWGNTADPVLPADVARVRASTRGRILPWQVAELDRMFD